MQRINFDGLSAEEFRELEKAAWNGTLDFNEFPAAEYKFFDTVQALGQRHRLDKVPTDLLRSDMTKARRVYDREAERLQYSLEVFRKYQDAVLRSDRLRCEIDKAAPADKLALALQCIELLTGEDGFAKRNL